MHANISWPTALLALVLTLAYAAWPLSTATATEAGVEIRVLAAVSLKESLEELAAAFEKETGCKVSLSLGASSLLARQIAEGAPADIFLSADEDKMNMLEQKELLKPGTRVSLLGNTLVLVVPADATGEAVPSAIEDLTRNAVRKIAIAEPKSVPAGIYARQYLEAAKLYEVLQPKLVPCENVRATMGAVESGHADAGFIYKTDALVSKKIAVAMEFPASKGGPLISYPVAILKDTKQLKHAEAFIAFIRRDSAKTTWEKRGFEVIAR
ncbi:molybdate ABC transporter substrate-binding protein [Verrucomicrobia bacterium LW23]|nr:molybdate ABC transporter substrate-binding protein [Verrucomicrobia bacterium LW23]